MASSMPGAICLAMASSLVRGFALCGTSGIPCRWLLKHIQGVLVLEHSGNDGRDEDEVLTSEEADREKCIALVILPLLSGILPPEASVHLELMWGMSPSTPAGIYGPAHSLIGQLHSLQPVQVVRKFRTYISWLVVWW